MNNTYVPSFDDFIKSEEYFSNMFYEYMQITDREFNKEEYNFIAEIFYKDDLIVEIYDIIYDLLVREGLSEKYSHLVFADFIFSMTSNNVMDPSELIFQTTRDRYFSRIRFRSLINYMVFGIDYVKYLNNIHKKLLIGLRVTSIINRKVIRNKDKNNWASIVYLRLMCGKFELENNIRIGYGKEPFKIISIYKSSYSIGSFRNIWKTKRKKKEMENIIINDRSILKSNKIALVLSKDLYDLNNNHIIKEKEELLKKVKCESIEEYFKKLVGIIEDKKYSYKLLLGIEKIDNVKWKDIYKMDKELKEDYLNKLKVLQKIVSIHILKKNIFDIKIYLPCFMDNRGRQYYGTLISPTFYKLFRYLYKFDKLKNFEKLEKSLFYRKIIMYKKYIKWELSDKDSYIAIVLFIEVGKYFIKNMSSVFIKTEDILKIGISKFEEHDVNIDFEDKLYMEKIYLNISKLIKNEKIDDNLLIFKDATSSGLQNYGIILGYRKDMLKYLNMDGDDWCDTYQYIINKFLKTDKEYLYNRKYWKSTIMTIPYNAEWYTCFKNFLKKLDNDKIIYKEMNDKDKENLKEIHKDFYNRIKNEIKNEFYENIEKNMKMFKYNQWVIHKKIEYKINYKKARDKYTDIIYLVNEDEKSTNIALEANNMHYLDAMLVKEILGYYDILPIHDCFGIRLCEIHSVIDKINEYYNKKTGCETYCIHIIL